MASIPPRARRSVAIALLIALAGPACRKGADAPTPQSSSDSSGLRDVLLADGSHVHIRSRGLRVFASSASVVDFVSAIAPPERLAAIPEQARDYASAPADEQRWRQVPRFSSFVAETVIARSPDLVIAEPWGDKDTVARLRAANIEVVVLPEVRSWKDARATLICVGSLLQLEDRARAVAGEFDLRVEALAANPGKRRGLRAMCYSNFGSGGWSAGIHTTIHEQIVLAGMNNAMAERGADGHVQVTFEDLITFDPDLLIVSMPLREGDGTQGDRGGASRRLLESEPSLRGLAAIKKQRIVALPASLFASASQAIVRGAEVLAADVDELLAREAAAENKR